MHTIHLIPLKKSPRRMSRKLLRSNYIGKDNEDLDALVSSSAGVGDGSAGAYCLNDTDDDDIIDDSNNNDHISIENHAGAASMPRMRRRHSINNYAGNGYCSGHISISKKNNNNTTDAHHGPKNGGDLCPTNSMTTSKKKELSLLSGDDSPRGSHYVAPPLTRSKSLHVTKPAAVAVHALPIRSLSGGHAGAATPRMRRRHSINYAGNGFCSGPISITKNNNNNTNNAHHVPKKIIQVAGEVKFVVDDTEATTVVAGEGCVEKTAITGTTTTTTTAAHTTSKDTVPKSPVTTTTTSSAPTAPAAADAAAGDSISPVRGVRQHQQRRRLSLNLSTLGQRPYHDNLHRTNDLINYSPNNISNSDLNSPPSLSRAKLYTSYKYHEPSLLSPSSPSASSRRNHYHKTLKTMDSKYKPTSSPTDSKIKIKVKLIESRSGPNDESKSKRTATTTDSSHESKSSKTSKDSKSNKPTRSPTTTDSKVKENNETIDIKKKTECCISSVSDHERAINERQLEIEKLERAIKKHKREQKRLMDEKKRLETLDRLKQSASKVKAERNSAHSRSSSKMSITPTNSPKSSKKTCVDSSSTSTSSMESWHNGKERTATGSKSDSKDKRMSPLSTKEETNTAGQFCPTVSKVNSESSNKKTSSPSDLLLMMSNVTKSCDAVDGGHDKTSKQHVGDDQVHLPSTTTSNDRTTLEQLLDDPSGLVVNNDNTNVLRAPSFNINQQQQGPAAVASAATLLALSPMGRAEQHNHAMKRPSFATHWVLSPTSAPSVAAGATAGHYLELDILELQETQLHIQSKHTSTSSPQKKKNGGGGGGGGGMAQNIRKRFGAMPRRTSIG